MKFQRKMELQRFRLMRIVRTEQKAEKYPHTHTRIDWLNGKVNQIRNTNESFVFGS